MELSDKSIVVTGGATGIGLGIARQLVTAGAKVAIGSRTQSAIDAATKELQDLSESNARNVLGLPLDVSQPSSVDEFFSAVADTHGSVDVLIQAAGINTVDRSLSNMSLEDWDRVLRINASGAYYCMRAVLPGMKKNKEGIIVNISSIAGKRSLEIAGVAYSASKFAMTALGTAASNELAPEGIRVTNIYPGEVNTPILDRRPVALSQEHRAQILQPVDVASMVMAILALPARAHVPEMVIKPTSQEWF